MSPVEFIGVAEDTGLIGPIGAWVMRTACRHAATWNEHAAAHGQPPITVSVNLSPRQFDAGDLVQTVEDALASTGMPPDLLWLEITESALMRDTASTVAILHDLRRLGVHLSIDDFGTGYSSLSYLKRFPVEALKIDQSFTDGLGTEPEDTAIVTAVVGLAHALNLRAIAEGVETPAQHDYLRRLGCEGAQGYYFGRPTAQTELGDDPRAAFAQRAELSTPSWGKTPTADPGGPVEDQARPR
jgi:EAL domain-containing protein (putative c-di-GMP-specific phosphodiesterase class I)